MEKLKNLAKDQLNISKNVKNKKPQKEKAKKQSKSTTISHDKPQKVAIAEVRLAYNYPFIYLFVKIQM